MAINALRKEIGDEDQCNKVIVRELEKGPQRIRVLSREELKIEIKKYKNISLKIIRDFQKAGGKVPGYAKTLVKEVEGNRALGEGLKKMKSETEDRMDDLEASAANSMFEEQSEMGDESYP